MNDGLDAHWMIAKMQEAATDAAMAALYQTRERGVMPAKVRVSVWAMKEDGTYCNTEYDTMVVPEKYEEFYQEYKRRQAAEKTEISKDEALHELHDIIDSFNDHEKSDDQGSDEGTQGPSE